MNPFARKKEDHEQCKCKRRSTGERCKNWVWNKTDKCRHHWKKYHEKKMKRNYKVKNRQLKRRVKQAMRSDASLQFNLREELALTRAAASESVMYYDMALTTNNSELRLKAADLMSSALKEVVDIAGKAADIESKAADNLSAFQVQAIVDQIIRIAYNTFGERADEFERLIQSRVRLPSSGHDGTDLTPDMDVMEMDASIPNKGTTI